MASSRSVRSSLRSVTALIIMSHPSWNTWHGDHESCEWPSFLTALATAHRQLPGSIPIAHILFPSLTPFSYHSHCSHLDSRRHSTLFVQTSQHTTHCALDCTMILLGARSMPPHWHRSGKEKSTQCLMALPCACTFISSSIAGNQPGHGEVQHHERELQRALPGAPIQEASSAPARPCLAHTSAPSARSGGGWCSIGLLLLLSIGTFAVVGISTSGDSVVSGLDTAAVFSPALPSSALGSASCVSPISHTGM